MTKAFRGDRLHIAVLGRCNTGKSTVLNYLTGQRAAIVSSRPGTTGDPVGLSYELLPLGPVTFYDTAGLDEESELGHLRREAGRKVLSRADIAVVVTDEAGVGPLERELVQTLRDLETPTLLLFNKADIGGPSAGDMSWCAAMGLETASLSADRDEHPERLREILMRLAPDGGKSPALVVDAVPPGGVVILVTPIDDSAPKGRLIVPQVQVLRELVEHNRPVLVAQPSELPRCLALLREPPALVVTDSQAVREVAAALPDDMPMTTFSVLFARLKGDFPSLLESARAIDTLQAGARVLIAEACAHHTQDDDIARVKLPALLKKHRQSELSFNFCSGGDFPADLRDYALIIHCGGCMLTPREMKRRLRLAAGEGVAVTNFGMAISLCQGVLERVAAPLLETGDLLSKPI